MKSGNELKITPNQTNMKTIILTSIIFLSCRTAKEPLPEIPVVVIHDTISIVKPYFEGIDSTVKVLLIQYYKAGWMDGSNAIIDLHNSESLENKSVKKMQFTDWRKMEIEVNSKKLNP